MSGVVHDEALGHRASIKRSLAEYRAKNLPRFYLMRDGKYLHMSGQWLTSTKAYAYVGSASQCAAIQASVGFTATCAMVEV